MDVRLIPVVLPAIKKVCQLERCKDKLKRFERSREKGVMIDRYKSRLKENISKLEKELGYEVEETKTEN
jgi:predicted RNase H-like nuclease (RuvC/YqgF family)